MNKNDYILKLVRTDADWETYHRIRRTVLFEERGYLTHYDPNHPDEYVDEFHPLLLTHKGIGIGTVRLDEQPEGFGIVRLVAIDSPEQRKGHGQNLMRLIEDMAKSKDMPYLEVNSAHEVVEFYEKVGYLALAREQHEADQTPQCVDQGDDLGGQSAP